MGGAARQGAITTHVRGFLGLGVRFRLLAEDAPDCLIGALVTCDEVAVCLAVYHALRGLGGHGHDVGENVILVPVGMEVAAVPVSGHVGWPCEGGDDGAAMVWVRN